MAGGFGAVPDELLQTANTITDAVGRAGSMLWQGPSGDYGHPGVRAGWGSFIDDLKTTVQKLCQQAYGHGDDLRAAATSYADSDSDTATSLGKVGGLIEAAGGQAGMTGASSGAGFTGGSSPIANRLSGGGRVN